MIRLLVFDYDMDAVFIIINISYRMEEDLLNKNHTNEVNLSSNSTVDDEIVTKYGLEDYPDEVNMEAARKIVL